MNLFIVGFFFISIFGTLLHFTYDWSNHNKFVGLFSAVNESTWEHIKMTLTSYFLWSFIDVFFLISNPNYLFAKAIGLITIIIVMPLIFYGYRLFVKESILLIDIGNFFVTVFLSQLFFYLIMKLDFVGLTLNYIALIIIFVVFALYLILTLFPIKNFIFKDPITNKYGLKGHK